MLRVLQFSIWLCGISLLIWAFRDARFRDAEGFLKGEFCLPVSVSIALLIFGSAVTGTLKRFAFWFALAIVGQAVALQMIEAGSSLRYQHYKPLGRLLVETQPLILIFLVLQTALVAVGLSSHLPRIRAAIGRSFKVWQLLAVGLLFFLSSATVSREIPVYLAELPFAAFVQTLNLANIALMILALPKAAPAWLKRRIDTLLSNFKTQESEEGDNRPLRSCASSAVFLDREGDKPQGGPRLAEENLPEKQKGAGLLRLGIDRFAMWAAVWVTALAAVVSCFSYERHPHIGDEVAYLYHARYFASGMVTMPAPPVPAAFDIDLMNYEQNTWYCPVPPGWPAVLALGVLFGAPWLVNPVLAGLSLLLTYVFVRRLYDRRTARIVVLLMCISPWYIFMAMNFMGHMSTLTCALVAAVAVMRCRETSKAKWGLVAGIAVGVVSLIRPLDGVIVGGLIGLWGIGIGGRRLKVTSIAALALGCFIVGAAQLYYNKLLTGSPTVFPINAFIEKYYPHNANAYGFGPDRGMGWAIDPFPGHGPIDALINANLNTFSMNIELFGWSTGSLLLAALMLFSGTPRKSDYLMIAVLAAVFVAYFFYYFSGGPDFGARYWFLMLVPLVTLTVRGVQFLEGKLEAGPAGFTTAGAGVLVAVLSLSALTLVNYFPWRAIDKYHHYLGMRPDIRSLATERDFGKSLVLIRGHKFPDYMSAAIYNPLNLHADVPVYAWDRNPKVRAQLLKTYADRSVWIVDGPSITHGGFKVVDGPLSALELVSEADEARHTSVDQ